MEDKITLVSKRKYIQTLLDYAMDQQISFTVSPKGLSAEEFDISLVINGIKQAVALGMFAKEHKFEVLGQTETPRTKPVSSVSKKTEVKENSEKAKVVEATEQQSVTTVLEF